MTRDTSNAIIALAREEAAETFLHRFDDDHELGPLLSSTRYAQEKFPLEKRDAVEDLFIAAFMQDMARRWLAETTRRLEEMSK